MPLKPMRFTQSPGTVLTASWLNVILYTSQVALSIYYLRHFTATRWLRGWIFASLFIDGLCTIVAMVGVYMYLIRGQGPSHTIYTWTSKVIVLCTYSSASIAHVFFCHRYWTISKNKWITGCIIFLITANILGTVASTVITSLYPGILVLAVPLTLSSICAAADLTTAVSLAWTCWHIQSPHANTKNLLRRTAIQALTCGFTTAIFTTIMSISIFIVWNVFSSCFAVLGRVYSLTILITLMLLKAMNRSDSSSGRVDGDSDSSEPAVLDPIYFNHTLDTEAGKGQSSNDGNFDTTHPSTQPTFTTISNDHFIRTA
ncbi:hypothetical protein EDD18DRAFT_346795 [Armillaria luteobubalina]|uniref:Transmembrane protein n=1 Tax=Armillaria luteobubalina TaxID=153913 RepID=A0AA39ULP8_9AGAR|nr:hypothetical protein EDD18DRAFT_346795 [Armillaria luteobubalina]